MSHFTDLLLNATTKNMRSCSKENNKQGKYVFKAHTSSMYNRLKEDQ